MKVETGSPGDGADADARIAEATRRTRAIIVDGYPIRLISTQLTLTLVLVFMGLFAAVGTSGLETIPIFGETFGSSTRFILITAATLYLVGLIISIVAYVLARTTRRLFPQSLTGFTRPSYLEPLLQSERRSIGLQLRGRQPVRVEFVELLAALIELNRVTNQSIIPSLVGMFVAFFGASLALAWPLAAMFVVLGVFLVVMTRIERRRLDRVETHIRAA